MSLWLFLSLLLLFISPAVVFCSLNVEEIKPCSEDCTLYQGKYLSSRMWSLKDKSTFTSKDVSSTYEKGFSPHLTQRKGFHEYVSAPLCGNDVNTDLNRMNSDLIIEYDIFDTKEQGNHSNRFNHDFRDHGVLYYQIDPVREFWGMGKIDIHIRRKEICQIRSDKFYLSTHLWKIVEGCGLKPHDVSQEFLKTFVQIIKKQKGFIQFLGVEREDEKVMFLTVFEKEEQAIAANGLALEYQENHSFLSVDIERVIVTVSKIDFDFLCTSPQDSMDSKFCKNKCKHFEGKRFDLRGWQKTDPQMLRYSNDRIVEELFEYVAPVMAQVDGFNSYNGIVLNDTDRALFFDVFDIAERAVDAEEIEMYVQANGVLKTEMCKDRFESGYYQFHRIHPRACVIVGKAGYITTQLWRFQSGCTSTAKEIIEIVKKEFAWFLERQDGFLEFAGIVLDGGDDSGLPYFYSVFQTKEGAEKSWELMRGFVEKNEVLSGQIEILDLKFGFIKEEWQCQYRKNEKCHLRERREEEREKDLDSSEERKGLDCYEREEFSDCNKSCSDQCRDETNINLHFGELSCKN